MIKFASDSRRDRGPWSGAKSIRRIYEQFAAKSSVRRFLIDHASKESE